MTLDRADVIDDAHERVLRRACGIADDVLFPTALDVERCDVLPRDRFDTLAGAGLYGMVGPQRYGGFDCPPSVAGEVVEALAGGCLATTFVWLQHHGAVRALTVGNDETLRRRWLPRLCSGDTRAGIVFAGLIPGPPRLTATPEAEGWRLAGTAEWVSGWGLVDILLVLARGPDDTLVSLLVDATERPGIAVARQRLTAIDASATVSLTFDGLTVPYERMVASAPFDARTGSTADALRTNGSLALGVAGRACRLLGAGQLDHRLQACRVRLASAGDDDIADARAAASALAVQATSTLVVEAGARSILTDAQPQRLAREALVLLVFGSRPAIKASLAARLVNGVRAG